MNNAEFTIIAFYQFKKFVDLEKQKKILKDFCYFQKIKGTILLANEGINGTVGGFSKSINLLKNKLKDIGFNDLEFKYSNYKFMPFHRMKIKIKKEIVTFDDSKLDVINKTAQHIDSSKWNNLILNKDILLVDVRNNFEYAMGTFQGSINPKTNSFSEFKKYVDKILSKEKNKKIAMFCTGGIRCEKASSYMLSKGFKSLFQLKGGILKYLADISKEQSTWNGECFVFDNRVSVQNELIDGTYSLCHGCRYPISRNNMKSYKYEEGVTCLRCYDKLTIEKKNKLKERNKQIKISKKRGLYNPYIKVTPLDF